MWPMIALVVGALVLFRVIRLPLQRNLAMLAAIALVAYGAINLGWLNAPVGAATTAAGSWSILSVTEADTETSTDTISPTTKQHISDSNANLLADLTHDFNYTFERSDAEKAGVLKLCFSTDGVFHDASDTSDSANYEIVDRNSDGTLNIDVNVGADGCRQIGLAEAAVSSTVGVKVTVDNTSQQNVVADTEYHYIYVNGNGATSTVDFMNQG